MSDNFYTTTTAALKATKADIRNLNAQEIKLKDKNILDYIKDSEFDSYDTRDPQLKNDELDIWNTEISLSEEGHIEVKPKEHGITYDNGYVYEGITESQQNTLKTAVKVIDNEVLGADDAHLMYWQTDGLTGGNKILNNCSALTTFNSDLSSLTNGYQMFYNCSNITSFNGNLSSLTEADRMFSYCSNLITFSSDLLSLSNGSQMFYNCTNLTSFSSNLSSLTNGAGMFFGCTALASFSSDLPNLTDGAQMFWDCIKLESVNSNLSSLMTGRDMFSGCSNLTSFTSDLPNLTNGYEMFFGCTTLTSFNGNLSSLADGEAMFYSTKLDAHSVANIVHTLPTHELTKEITIGIGCDNTEVDQLLFAQECDCETWQELLDEFSAKNWTVSFQCKGRLTEATTYNMRRDETLPVYTKLEEVIMPTSENEHKPHYTYTSQDGSKFYNINYFHSTNGSTEGYDVFSSLEEAISTYNVTPKN